MSENTGQNRLLSLDVFRGMTIAGMVLVNNPGTWSAIYSPLAHAEWHGATPTDFVFPFFLFIVGIAITLALGKRVEQAGINKDIYLKIFRRALIIFAHPESGEWTLNKMLGLYAWHSRHHTAHITKLRERNNW